MYPTSSCPAKSAERVFAADVPGIIILSVIPGRE